MSRNFCFMQMNLSFFQGDLYIYIYIYIYVLRRQLNFVGKYIQNLLLKTYPNHKNIRYN